jgi:hypothetical protein
MPRRPELYRKAMLDLYCDSFPSATSPWISTKASIGASRNYASSTPITMTFCRSTSSTPAAGWLCPCCARRRRRAILALVKRVVGHLCERFPRVRIRLRGDSHYACPEVMSWCEARGIEYIFGLAGTAPLAAQVQTLEARTAARYAAPRTAEPPKFKLRRYMDFRGKSWNCQRRIGSKPGPMGSTPATSSPT